MIQINALIAMRETVVCAGSAQGKNNQKEAEMTSVAEFRHSTTCTQCGEDLIAPERSEYVGMREIRHFWCCSNCGCEFDTLDCLPDDEKLPPELVKDFLPTLLVA
ncbi:MAG TPA: hypothetical protein VMI47_08085 [Pseudolabrys sp.]|nr:hypothetical protein [Pseudolabrys sp.]